MSMQYVVTVTDRSISVQRLKQPMTLPPDAEFVSTGANPQVAAQALAQDIYANVPVTTTTP